MKKRSVFVSSLLLAILVGAGCARKPDDGKISSDVQSRFSQDSGLSSKQLTVQASDGVVTLSGVVDDEAQRDAAGRQAGSVAGVKTVINNLTVGAGAATQSASAAPQMSTAKPPAAPVKMKAAPTKRARKPSKPADSDTATSDANAGQTMASNQPDAMANNAPPPADNAAANSPPPPPPPKQFIIDQGTRITVRLIDPIDSEKNQTGDTFHATLNAALTSDGQEAVPSGVELTGHLVEVKSAGKFAGQSVVAMQLDSLSYGGKTYNLQTDQYKKEGSSRGKNTAEKVGGGAVIGSIIGAIAGGGKGAAIGGAAGAGVGGGVQAATKGQQIKLPSETVLNFTLQAPVTVVQAPKPDANRQKLTDAAQ